MPCGDMALTFCASHTLHGLLITCGVELVVGAFSFRLALRTNTFDQDLTIGRRSNEEIYGLSDVISERHGIRVRELVSTGKLSLHVRWGKFKNFNRCIAKLIPERLRPRMNCSLCGTIGGI